MHYLEIQGLSRNSVTIQRFFKEFCHNSRTSQDKQSNSRAFQYCTNPVSRLHFQPPLSNISPERTPYTFFQYGHHTEKNWCELHENEIIRASWGGIRIKKLASWHYIKKKCHFPLLPNLFSLPRNICKTV